MDRRSFFLGLAGLASATAAITLASPAAGAFPWIISPLTPLARPKDDFADTAGSEEPDGTDAESVQYRRRDDRRWRNDRRWDSRRRRNRYYGRPPNRNLQRRRYTVPNVRRFM